MSKLTLILIISTIIIWSNFYNIENNGLWVHFLDIGQGDSIIIRTVDNKIILVDGGPDNSVVNQLNKVIPYWFRNIDLVILTHPDLDHVGGLPEILNIYKIGKVLYTDLIHKNYAYQKFEENIKQWDIDILEYDDKSNFKVGCCTYLNLLSPTKDIIQNSDVSVNDKSIVFELIYDDINMFFGGDIGEDIENLLVDKGEVGKIDLLKVSHHGSMHSSPQKFIQRIKPEYAVISSKIDNKFGHPHQEVLDTLENNNVKILRTDISGTISVYSDGKTIRTIE